MSVPGRWRSFGRAVLSPSCSLRQRRLFALIAEDQFSDDEYGFEDRKVSEPCLPPLSCFKGISLP
jgi:hypothetical protein